VIVNSGADELENLKKEMKKQKDNYDKKITALKESVN